MSLPSTPSSPSLLVHLLPQGLLPLLPPRTPLAEVASCLRGAPTPPALGCGANFCPVRVLSGAAVPRLQLVEPRGQPLGTPCDGAIRLLVFGILYFALKVRPPAHFRVSAHFFSEISRLILASDLGS